MAGLRSPSGSAGVGRRGVSFDAPLGQCPLCDSPRLARYDRDFQGITIDRCGACGLRFMNPQYSDEHLGRYYAGYIDVNETQTDPVRGRARRAHKTEHLELIERYQQPGRFLSLGCGDGLELEIAAERGWRAEGWDVSPETTRRVAQRTGLSVRSGELAAAGFEPAAYDCVFLDQVLEHPKSPGELLRACHTLLRPGGVLYVGCPNIGSVSCAWQTWMGRLHLKRRRGRHYDTWHHLSYHTPRALAGVLEQRYGFDVLVQQGDPKPHRRSGALGALNRRLQTRFPLLDSSFRIVARARAPQA